MLTKYSVLKMIGYSNIRTTQIYAIVLDKKVEFDMDKLNNKLYQKNNLNNR